MTTADTAIRIAALDTWYDPEWGSACVISLEAAGPDGARRFWLVPGTSYNLAAEDGDWFAVDPQDRRHKITRKDRSIASLPTERGECWLNSDCTYEIRADATAGKKTPRWELWSLT
ncbi:hypothetical protein Lfu02_40690 [Longispora fulva]|uniref:Uncharacterized protein n=1 Tax=Longispora fulva TaxID=619741 RepID=A0A8J7KPP1_9ACTN|nr:hypothetical protein [Longispora fulva]MBG6136527.1 hypothetical protein [Longispora fulva]GIG59697.1 hypothetical protein Lfu02_40690 [Longispora fulva]